MTDDEALDEALRSIDASVMSINEHCKALYREGEDPKCVISALLLTAVYISDVLELGGLEHVRALLGDKCLDTFVEAWLKDDERAIH